MADADMKESDEDESSLLEALGLKSNAMLIRELRATITSLVEKHSLEMTELQTNNLELEVDNVNLNAENEELNADYKELNAANEELKANYKKLNTANELLKTDNEELTTKNLELEAENVKLKNGIKSLIDDNKKCNEELEKCKQSNVKNITKLQDILTKITSTVNGGPTKKLKSEQWSESVEEPERLLSEIKFELSNFIYPDTSATGDERGGGGAARINTSSDSSDADKASIEDREEPRGEKRDITGKPSGSEGGSRSKRKSSTKRKTRRKRR
jgi:chromosome segregation ATPase